MLQWILSVFFGCILLNPLIDVHVNVQASAVPIWKSNVHQHQFDDCYHCHARNQELERRIQTLEANIREHVLDTFLQERLLAPPLRLSDRGDLATYSVEEESPVIAPRVRSKRVKRQYNSGTEYSFGCVPYPDYIDNDQCTICGGNNASNAWQEACQGRCQQEIYGLCVNSSSDTLLCLEEAICIDCSDVSATTRHLEQVPCPPDEYLEDTQWVVLLLDNNHHLNLTNAFNTGTAFASVGGISFSNTTLHASQFNFDSMLIFWNFNMSSATIIGGIKSDSFYHTMIFGSFDMSSANMSGGIDSSAFSSAMIGGNFDISSATISGRIRENAFQFASIHGNFDMRSATISGGIGHVFYETDIYGNFDMSAATISGGISDYTFQAAIIHGNFDMSSATISGGISSNTFYDVIIGGHLDMSSATISGGISNLALSRMAIGGSLSFNETIFQDGGIEAYSFAGTSVGGFLNASGARFPEDTLPIQMLFGLQVAQGVDFSHCNLKNLEESQCASDGCFSLDGIEYGGDDDDGSVQKVQGGPFTGMAMPVGIASTFFDLSHNNLTEIINTSLLGITASTLDLSHNQISVFHPFWFLGAPNAKFIVTTGNPSTCERNRFNSTTTEAYTYQEAATITCKCSSDTNGTGNFCAKQSCNETLQSLNVYSRAYLGGGYYESHGDAVLSGDTATLQCPAGKHPNSDSAVSARCLGGAFEPQTNECVTTSWFTPGRIAGIVVGVLIPVVIIAAIIGYVLFLSPEKRKGKLFQNEVELKEQLLHDTNCDLEEATALNTRMRGAWKIEETDIQIGSVVASGAFGVVHDGKFGGLRVAVKVLKQPLDEELYPDVGIDFTRECETLMAIRHACLLIFYGAGLTSENRPFMVTEFMPKGSLKKVLADAREELVWPLRLKFAQQIAKGMEYLHSANIIHRDLKSDNCLVNDELDVKVCDFGTSKFLTAGRSTLQSSSLNVDAIGNDSLALSATMTKGVGTILWMAPELFVGGTHYKQEVDMYSYGMIMWELLTRQIPWCEIEDTSYLHFYKALDSAIKNNQRPRIPTELMEAHHDFVVLMQRCWATNPQSRPTFKQVIQMLA